MNRGQNWQKSEGLFLIHLSSSHEVLLCPRLLETPEARKERVVFKELDVWPQSPKSLENSEVLNIT